MDPRPLAVVDIDGVVADVRHRLHFIEGRPRQWDRFFAAAGDDPPQPEGVAGGARNNNSPAARAAAYQNGLGMGSPNAAAVPAMLPNSPMVPAQRGDAAIDPATGRPMVAWPGNETQVGVAEAQPTGRRLTLTERELQVLRGMADGKSTAEIGRELFVSEDTVKTHARRLFRKLGARDRAHAVAAGFRAGLVA